MDIARPREHAVTLVTCRARSDVKTHNPWVGTTLMQFLECFDLADLLELHGMQGGSGFSPSCVSLARQRGREYTRSGGEMRITPPRGSGLGRQLHRHRSLHWGSSTYPLATMSSRVVREKEGPDWLWAEKGAVHDLVNSSCTYWVLGTGAEC